MYNFVRVLRHAWPYRNRLLISILCATLAAALWGGNFTAIYPVLKILHSNQSLHTWVDGSIAIIELQIDPLQKRLDQLDAEKETLEKQPPSKQIEKRKRTLSAEAASLETKLQYARTSIYWHEVLKKYIVSFLPDDRFRALAYLLLFLVVGIVVKCFFEFCQETLVGSVVNASIFDLRNRFYRNAIHLDVAQFNEQGTTELMSRFTNDVESVATGMKMLLGRVIAEPLRVVACVILACTISWQLTAMFLILVPVAALVLHRVGRMMRQATRRVLERMSDIYKILQETFQGIRVVKAFTNEAHERRRFREATRAHAQRAQKVVLLEAMADPVIEILAVAAVALALLTGSYLVLTKHTHLFGLRMCHAPLEPESMLQLYALMAAIADPVRKLSSVFTKMQSAFAASDRVFALLDKQPNIASNYDGPRLQRPEWLREPQNAAMLPMKQTYIEFRDVCFSYDKAQPVLSQVSFEVRGGETIAIVGANGCGKSSLVRMIPRFYDPDHGSVLIDGIDVRKLHLPSLRRQIAVVNQELFLFDDTIFANIAYGRPAATQEEVEAAAKKAFAHEFIMNFPKGYQTRVGELGTNLSGGQRQKLTLARAILRDPSILILDEFTNQADAVSDVDIHRAIRDFKHGRTVFIITHRLNTLEIADRIVVLDRGQIVAIGTHAELMSCCVVYQRLNEAYTPRKCA
jgi:ATP-binding cassette subfamily B protein/subfamily B ATP-binding cassette protein MsbA